MSKDENAIEYSAVPIEGDPELGIKVFQLAYDGIGDKEERGVHARIIKGYKQKRNRFFKAKSTANRPLLSANYTQKHIRDMKARLCKGQPVYNILPVGVESTDPIMPMIDQASRLTQYKWNEREFQEVYRNAVGDGETYGFVVSKIVFDPQIGWEGDADWQIIDPVRFVTYPVDTIDVQACEVLLEIKSIKTAVLKLQYPGQAGNIKEDGNLLDDADEERKDPSPYEQNLSGLLTTIGKVYDSMSVNEGYSTVIEAWIRDYTPKAKKDLSLDGEGNPIPELKYSGGIRMVRTCNGGELVLFDGDNPSVNQGIPRDVSKNSYLFDMFPYIRTCSLNDTADPYGSSDPENFFELQEQINLCLSMMLKERNESATKIIKVPKDSGVPVEDIRRGTTSTVTPSTAIGGQGITVENAGVYNEQFGVMFDRLSILFKEITGSNQLMQSDQGGQGLDYKKIAMMKEDVDDYIREKHDNYGRMIREVGRMLFSIYQHFYTEPRWFEFEENGEQQQGTIDMQQDSFRFLKIPVKLSVVRSSIMPDSKVQRREESNTFYEMGVFGPPGSAQATKHLLKERDWAGWADIVKELEGDELQAKMASLEAAGFPPALMENISTLLSMDPEEVQTGIEGGDVKSFGQVHEELMEPGEDGQPAMELQPTPIEQMLMLEIEEKQLDVQGKQIENQMKEMFIGPEREAEIEKLREEARKIGTDADLNETRAYVAKQGVFFDETMIKIQKAREILNAQMQKAQIANMRLQTAMSIGGNSGVSNTKKPSSPKAPWGTAGAYNEKSGIRSNNVRLSN
jgi:hypothetical protein